MASHFENGLDMTKWKDAAGSGNTIDEDGDTDGDKDEEPGEEHDGEYDEEYGDAIDEMDETDEDKNNGNPSSKRQRKGGPSSEFDSQYDTTTLNNSLSTLTLDMIRRPRPTCNGSSSLHRSGSDSVLLSLNARNIKLHNNPPFTALAGPQNSSWSTSRQDAELQRSLKQHVGVEKPSLRAALREARVNSEDHRFFIPINEIQRLITFYNVVRELKFYYGDTESSRATASLIIKNARTLFAILIFIGKGSAIENLILKDGISDLDLPISWTKTDRLSTFNTWPDQEIENFCRCQWSFVSPVLGPVGLHHEFDDHVVLPFVGGHLSLVIGGYSEVWKAKLHSAHQKLFPTPLDTPLLVAVKQLRSIDRIDFEAETLMLRQLAKKDHPHVVKLLATYRLNKRYHLVFPWASKDLRTYWQDSPNPRWNSDEILWYFQQMLGITSAIQTVHNFGAAPQALYGRHGDIKPENILYFDKLDGKERVLQIADFGLGKFHSWHSRSGIDPRTVRSTRTYEPPEVARLRPVSRTYDIWSLGCVFLEFITWILGGQNLLDSFRSPRIAVGGDSISSGDEFYIVVQDPSGASNAYLGHKVRSWIQILLRHEKCSEAVHDLLCLIKDDLLVVDAEKRKSSTILLSSLQRLVRKAENDETYLLKQHVDWETSQSLTIIQRYLEDIKGVEADSTNISSLEIREIDEINSPEKFLLYHLNLSDHEKIIYQLYAVDLLVDEEEKRKFRRFFSWYRGLQHPTTDYDIFLRTAAAENSIMKRPQQEGPSTSLSRISPFRKLTSLLRSKKSSRDCESVCDSGYYSLGTSSSRSRGDAELPPPRHAEL